MLRKHKEINAITKISALKITLNLLSIAHLLEIAMENLAQIVRKFLLLLQEITILTRITNRSYQQGMVHKLKMHMRRIHKFQGCYLQIQKKEIIFQKFDFIIAEQLFSQLKHQVKYLTIKNQTRIIYKLNKSRNQIKEAIILMQKRITLVLKLRVFSSQ